MKMIKNNNIKSRGKIKVKDYMSIGEVAKIAEVNTSAIRHWEKEGLIFSERDNNNGYRMFSVNELRKVLIISSLRKIDRKSTRLNSSHVAISYAVFCLKKKNKNDKIDCRRHIYHVN